MYGRRVDDVDGDLYPYSMLCFGTLIMFQVLWYRALESRWKQQLYCKRKDCSPAYINLVVSNIRELVDGIWSHEKDEDSRVRHVIL